MDMDMDMDSLNTMRVKQGFTLLELSIVLVIIGLIIGGVVAGRDLIKSAEVQSIGKEMTSYEVIYNTFKLKYNGVPGDLKNATQYWPSAASGNGDGKIYWWGGETIDAWHHLSLSGMVPGSFDPNISRDTLMIDTNAPESARSGATYAFHYYGAGSPIPYNRSDVKIPYSNVLEIVKNGSFRTWGGKEALTKMEAYMLDRKLDDGLATTGLIRMGSGITSGGGCGRYFPSSGYMYSYMDTYAESEIKCTIFRMLKT